MKVNCLIVGAFQENCYIIENEKEVLIVDPGAKAKGILEALPEGKKVVGILLTHGHLDHIGAVDKIVKEVKCPVFVSEGDKEMLKSPRLNCSGATNVVVNSPVTVIDDGFKKIGDFEIEVFSTPGHTQGSLCYKIEWAIFTGDTLFRQSVGRTDLPTGSMSELRKSLRLFSTMDRELIVYPGHEEATTIGEELEYNPFLY